MRALAALTVIAGLVGSADPLRADDQSGSSQRPAAAAPDGELRRRALFGAQFATETTEALERRRREGVEGIVIERILPGTSAAHAGFEAGDVILSVDGVRVPDFAGFLQRMAGTRDGDVVTVSFVREGVRQERAVTLEEMPREQGAGYDVLYAQVASHGARLRTIITRPRDGGRHPAVMLLQGGHTCFPIDASITEPSGFVRIAQDLAAHGFVTMRVERPGCGDSEGGPLRDVDFDVELDGLTEALRALKRLEYVDAGDVFLFGHSMGGIMAPLMAVESPVRGIAVYGSTAETWFESVFAQRRRLASLDGTNASDLDREILDQLRLFYPLLVEKKTPLDIRESVRELPTAVWEAWVTDDVYVFGRHYRFYHQLADRNLTDAWRGVAAAQLSVEGESASNPRAPPVPTRVLSIWGTADWVGTRAAAAWIAEVVNRDRPGNGSFVVLDSIDHSFLRAASFEESFRYFRPAAAGPSGEFNPAILVALRSWLDEARASPASRSATPRSGASRLVRPAHVRQRSFPDLAAA